MGKCYNQIHAISLRRSVTGRSKSFDQLLSEHRLHKEEVLKRKMAAKVNTADSNSLQSTCTSLICDDDIHETNMLRNMLICTTNMSTCDMRRQPSLSIYVTENQPADSCLTGKQPNLSTCVEENPTNVLTCAKKRPVLNCLSGRFSLKRAIELFTILKPATSNVETEITRYVYLFEASYGHCGHRNNQVCLSF